MKRLICGCCAAVLFGLLSSASAGTKEEIMRLQSDVLAMQNQLREMEKSFNGQLEGVKSLVVQLNDQVGQSSLVLGRIFSSLDNQASGSKNIDADLLQEIRNLSNKFDDASTRISALAQQVSDIKIQANPIGQVPSQIGTGAMPVGMVSPEATYNQAYNDLVQGNLDLAIQEFTAFISNFPGSDRADDAQYYLGEAYLNQNKYPAAITTFTKILTDYSNDDKVPSALYKRAKAEAAQKETDNAIADYRAVIQKFPDTPEASLAKVELQKLRVPLTAPKPVGRKVRE